MTSLVIQLDAVKASVSQFQCRYTSRKHLHRNMSERKTFKQELVVGEGKGFFARTRVQSVMHRHNKQKFCELCVVRYICY